MRRTVEVMGLLRENFGNSSGEGNTLETVLSNLPGILRESSNLIGTAINGFMMAAASAKLRPMNGNAPTAASPAGATPTPAVAGSAPENQAIKSGEATQTEAQSIPADLLGLAQSAMDALHRGIDGVSFADGLFLTRGALYLQSIQSIGVEGIMAALSGVPQLQTFLPQVQHWVQEFCSYDPNEPVENEEPETDQPNTVDKPSRKRAGSGKN